MVKKLLAFYEASWFMMLLQQPANDRHPGRD
jgi:hypothetical protein